MAKNEKDPKRNDDNWDDIDDEEIDDEEEEEVEDEEGEDEDDEEEEEVEEEETAEVDVDPEDAESVPLTKYTVQMDYETADDIVEAGTAIDVKCGNCAMWQRPLKARNNKPLCMPGRPVNLKIGGVDRSWRMSEDRFSCQAYFVPKELEPLLELLTDDYDDVAAIRWIFPAVRKLFILRERVTKRYEKIGRDAEAVDRFMEQLVSAAMLFRSSEQIEHITPLVEYVANSLKIKRKKRTAKKRTKIAAGDEVSWTDEITGERVQGFIRTIAARNKTITLMVSGDSAGVLAPKEAKAWLEQNPGKSLQELTINVTFDSALFFQRDPQIVAETIVVDKTGEADEEDNSSDGD